MDTVADRAEATRDSADADGASRRRAAPLDMGGREFRALGHDLVERIAAFLDTLPSRPVTGDPSPESLLPKHR